MPISRRVLLALLLTLGAVPSRAQLPPQAQEAIDKGIIAAKVPDYLLAIRYFNDARRTAPQAPVVYLNLGLAESRVSGRELRAIAWFGAYLAALPEAPNAAAVKQQIAVLLVKNESDLARVLDSLQAAALQTHSDSRASNLADVAALWARAGDIEAATKLGSVYNAARRAIAEAQLRSGDAAAAQSTASAIPSPDERITLEIAIVEARVAAGDTAGARESLAAAEKTAAAALGFSNKAHAYTAIGAIYTRLGDRAAAQASYLVAMNTADRFGSDASGKAKLLADLSDAQLRTGEVSAGRATLSAARTVAEALKDEWQKARALTEIAEVQVRSGDWEEALKASERLDHYGNMLVRKAIIELQVTKGNFAAALSTAEPIVMDNKSDFQAEIAEAQIRAGDMKGANATLAVARKTAELVKTDYKAQALARVAEAMGQAGDLAGAKTILVAAQKAADVVPPDTFYLRHDAPRRQAQSDVAKTYARLGIRNPQVLKWFDLLDEAGFTKTGLALNSTVFLDLAGHLKSLPQSKEPQKVFRDLKEVSEALVNARGVVQKLLRVQLSI